MTSLPNGTWVVVADGAKALFLETVTEGGASHLTVRHVETQANPDTSEQGTDRPGRMSDAGGSHSSAVGGTDWHQLAEDRFAEDLADTLYAQAHKGRFEKLVLVAAPAVLGAVRAKLHKEVSSRLVGEIDKTLTNHPIDEIEKIVSRTLAEQALH